MNAPRRALREPIDGVLLLDKPVGLSSNAALQRARRLFNAAKAGHTGTLDPLASGLLPLCFGEATKFAQVLLDAPKRYLATIRFGVTTTTGDAEGDVCATGTVGFGAAEVEAALPRFVGRIEQVPPAYAALKYQGRNYYEYARAGIDIPRAPRCVDVHALTLIAWSAPDAVVDVRCSKGTYVRTLAQDLGGALGAGAHLAALRRTMTGGFALTQAVTLHDLETMDADVRMTALLPADAPLADIPQIELDGTDSEELLQGRWQASGAPEGRYRAYGPGGRFLGLVEVTEGQLRAVRLIATPAPGKAAETAAAILPD